ncbi:MAG: hypothetical protein ACJ789_10380 [Thermomicrobiales bacterium]
MRLAVLKDRTETRSHEPRLAVVDKLAQVVEWPYCQPVPAEPTAFQVKADLHTKRFGDRDVESNRYTAELCAASSSAHAILSALTEACAQIDELRQPGSANDQIILEIRLRS